MNLNPLKRHPVTRTDGTPVSRHTTFRKACAEARRINQNRQPGEPPVVAGHVYPPRQR